MLKRKRIIYAICTGALCLLSCLCLVGCNKPDWVVVRSAEEVEAEEAAQKASEEAQREAQREQAAKDFKENHEFLSSLIPTEEQQTEEAEDDPKAELKEAFDEKINDKADWYPYVINDVTGNWRELWIVTTTPIDKDLAIDYVNAYFESDDEVHFIINFTLDTVTRINKTGNILSVTTLERTDKEELDAKKLASGMVLDSFVVDMDTGELLEDK